jgi:hypothetical protein
MSNEHVWDFLYLLYGGRPIIARTDKDIYSK